MWLFVKCRTKKYFGSEIITRSIPTGAGIYITVIIIPFSYDTELNAHVLSILKDYQIDTNKQLFVFFTGNRWQRLFNEASEPYFQSQFIPLMGGDESLGIRNALVLARIPHNDIMEIYKMDTWYVPIADTVKIRSSSELGNALAILKQPIIRNGEYIDFHHLVVYGESTDQIVGVIIESQIEMILATKPVRDGQESMYVRDYMIIKSLIPHFDMSLSLSEITKLIKKPNTWAMFYQSSCLFLVDEANRVVGFATYRDLLG